MSIENVESIDAASVRDGWAVLSIYQLDGWSSVEDPGEMLRAKLRTYQRFIESVHFQHSYYMAPVRIELQASETAPPEVRRICAQNSILLLDPSTVPDED
jgi:hypothetical protein